MGIRLSWSLKERVRTPGIPFIKLNGICKSTKRKTGIKYK